MLINTLIEELKEIAEREGNIQVQAVDQLSGSWVQINNVVVVTFRGETFVQVAHIPWRRAAV